MNKWTKRGLWALVIALALAGDSFITWQAAKRVNANADHQIPASAAARSDALTDFRLEREQLRARLTAQLNDIVYSDADGETVARARRQLLDMAARAEAEATVEGVLRARGFDDAVVTVSDSAANVLVRREALTQRETAVILELVMRETGLTGGNVKIIPVK